PGLGHPLDAVRGVAGLADDLEAGDRERLADPVTDQRVIVDHDDPDRRLAHESPPIGTLTSSSSPRSRPGRIATVPPSAAIRSRIPKRPERPGPPSSRAISALVSPTPSSAIESRIRPLSRASRTVARSAWPCRATFESASWVARK